MIKYTNDGTQSAPALRCYLNLMTLDDLPETSSGPRGDLTVCLQAIRVARFDGVQFVAGGNLAACESAELGMCRAIRVNRPEDADPLAAQLCDLGHECGTVHVGWGMEDDWSAMRLLEAVLSASGRHRLPLFPEIHRATVLQDMYRTVFFVERFPELRLNADFSQWYVGQEMVYGGFENKLAFIQPVLDRVGFFHGRVASPGCVQVAVEEKTIQPAPYLDHFRQMWTKGFVGFLRQASPGDYIIFAPELLSPNLFYAHRILGPSGELREDSDRWHQAQLLCSIAKECFQAAQQIVRASVA